MGKEEVFALVWSLGLSKGNSNGEWVMLWMQRRMRLEIRVERQPSLQDAHLLSMGFGYLGLLSAHLETISLRLAELRLSDLSDI